MTAIIETINVPDNLPFLKAICWQTADIRHFSEDEILDHYERGWHYRGVLADLEGEELDFLRQLANTKGSWLANDV